MRTDIKIGVVLGLIVVVVAGYLFYWDSGAEDIRFSEGLTQDESTPLTPEPDRPTAQEEPPRYSLGPEPETGLAEPPEGSTLERDEAPPDHAPDALADHDAGPPDEPAEPPVEPVPPPPGLTRVVEPPTSRPEDSGTAEQTHGPKLAGTPTTRPFEEPIRPLERPKVRTHIVEQGDTISKLAEQYYGSQRHTEFLLKANPQIKDPRRLWINMRLKIPPLPDEGAVSGDRDQVGAKRRMYRVKQGETFYKIAEQVLGDGRRWPEIFELNKEKVDEDPRNLLEGQLIELPGPDAAARP